MRQNLIQPFRGTMIQRAHPFSRGLVGRWPLNEGTGNKVFDYSGNGNHGTLTNMDPATDWVSGRNGLGFALDFDGDNDNILVGDVFEIGSEISVLFWATTTAAGNFFVSKAVNANYDFGCYVQSGTELRLFYGSNSNVNSTLTAPSDGSWHFYAYIASPSETRFHKDGQSESLSGITLADNNGILLIGSRNPVSIFGHTGKISDMQIYNYALREQEVHSHYRSSYLGFR